MKALAFYEHGEIDVLKLCDLPEPTPSKDEVLLKVTAVALNHLDIWVRRGWPGLNLKLPHITGSDIVGEVASENPRCEYRPGAQVMVYPGINLNDDIYTQRGEPSLSPGYRIIGEDLPGGLAEYVAVPCRNLLPLPSGKAPTQVAAGILTGLTCWRMLVHRSKLAAGQSVLVVGSGGGVNSLTIQLAKAFGAIVYALAGSEQKEEFARRLGADEVINYQAVPKWSKEVLKLTGGHGVDLVVDNVGAATMNQSLRAVARGGIIVTVGNTSGFDLNIDNRLIFAKQISLVGSTMGSLQDLIDVQEFMREHEIDTTVDCVAPLSDGIKMIRKLEAGEQLGKIVLAPLPHPARDLR